MVELLDLFSQAAQPLVFRRRRHRPIESSGVRGQMDFIQAVLFVEDDLAFEFQLGFPVASIVFQRLLVLEVRFFLEAAFGEQFHSPARAAAAEFAARFVLLHVGRKSELGAVQRYAFLASRRDLPWRAHSTRARITLVADVFSRLPALHAIQRRLRE